MSDDGPTLTLENTDGETATAELHYIIVDSADAFEALCSRHGLEYVGKVDRDATPFLWKAPATDVAVFTGCHPITGEFHGGGYKDEGYCSYVTITGPVASAEAVYRDLVETATYIKGEFQPLTVDDTGDVLAEIDVQAEAIK